MQHGQRGPHGADVTPAGCLGVRPAGRAAGRVGRRRGPDAPATARRPPGRSPACWSSSTIERAMAQAPRHASSRRSISASVGAMRAGAGRAMTSPTNARRRTSNQHAKLPPDRQHRRQIEQGGGQPQAPTSAKAGHSAGQIALEPEHAACPAPGARQYAHAECRSCSVMAGVEPVREWSPPAHIASTGWRGTDHRPAVAVNHHLSRQAGGRCRWSS